MDSDAWVVAVLAGVFTAAISGYVPAEAALLPALARSPQELSAANVTHSAMDNVGFLAAALTTGLLLHSAGPATVFGVAAAVALITTAGLTLIARDERPAYAADGEALRPLAPVGARLPHARSPIPACACSGRCWSSSSSSRAPPRSWS